MLPLDVILTEYIVKEYRDNLRSAYDISKEIGTYRNKILDILKLSGVPIRNKSISQKVALAKGRHPHPTKGKTHSQMTKEKIGAAITGKEIFSGQLTRYYG